MAISGTCALVIGALRDGPLLVLMAVALRAYVGTAVTMQLAVGFTLAVVTIWLVPVIRDGSSRFWAFVLLVPGPLSGVTAMLRLKSLPEAAHRSAWLDRRAAA